MNKIAAAFNKYLLKIADTPSEKDPVKVANYIATTILKNAAKKKEDSQYRNTATKPINFPEDAIKHSNPDGLVSGANDRPINDEIAKLQGNYGGASERLTMGDAGSGRSMKNQDVTKPSAFSPDDSMYIPSIPNVNSSQY